MTKEHMGITLALKIPFFIVLTKIDLCPQNILTETLIKLKKLLKSPQVDKMPILMKDAESVTDLKTYALQLRESTYIFIFSK